MTTLSPENEVSALAHQLLSPVTAAGNYAAAMATALKAGTLTPEKTADGLRRILQETERAQKTAAALKRLFRAEHPAPAPVNAVTLCQTLRRDFGNRFTLTITSSLPPLRADADLLTEALANLIENALTAQKECPTDAVTLTLSATTDGVRFTLSNPATDPEAALKILRTPALSRSPGGTGLGLLLAKRILQAHGATLTFSADGTRLCTRFTIPTGY